MLDKDTEYVFAKIKFIERYKSLAAKYQFNVSESFENYESNQVVNIISELGYEASFNKRETFFKITETHNNYKFQFNISLKYGVAEFIWSVWKNSELKMGGTWGILKEQLDGLENDKVRKPVFRNYEELKELLADAFLIYEDFKREYMQK